MRTALYRFKQLLTSAELPDVLGGQLKPETVPMEIEADLRGVWKTYESVRLQDSPRWDREIAVSLHWALRSLTRRQATDMRFWHWLCTNELRELVWTRWGNRAGNDRTLASDSRLAERFLGAPTLHGVSRNGLARLWWCSETLWSPSDGYELVRVVLSNQDFFQAVFERRFGLYPPAARAFIRTYGQASEEERRQAAKRFNHQLTTIVVESLSEEEIMELLAA